jgi:hypothetical protein
MLAEEIGAILVVTTATELLGRKSVEEIAEAHDLKIVNSESLTPVNSAIVNERKVLLAMIGRIICRETDIAPPKLISGVDQLKEMMEGYDAGIVIAPRVLSLEKVTKPVALLIPRPTQLPGTSYDSRRNQKLSYE